MDINFNTIAENASIITAKTVGKVTTNTISVPVTEKDENNNKITVYKTLNNPIAVNAINDISILRNISKLSLKGVVISMSRITDEHAKSVGLKSAKKLLLAMFESEYSENTIGKYRRIGKLFGNLEITDSYEWRAGIDSNVSVSNLDVVLTFFDGINVEELTDKELEERYLDFYEKYIATDLLHLSASQSTLKKEVQNLKNPPIDVEASEISSESTENTEKSDNSSDNSSDNTENTTNSENSEISSESAVENRKQTASDAITALALIFKENEKVKKLLAQIAKEIDTIQ